MWHTLGKNNKRKQIFPILTSLRLSCLRNVVSMLHILEREVQWRKEQGRPEGFETLRAHKPVIAVGAEAPLDDQKMLADYFRKSLASMSFYYVCNFVH